MSSSRQSNATTTRTHQRDGRVAADGHGIGISSEGPASVNIVADEAFEMGSDAINAVVKNTAQIIDATNSNTDLVATTVRRSTDRALAFGGGALTGALRTAERSNENMRRSTDRALAFGGGALTGALRTAERSNENMRRSTDRALAFGGGAFTGAMRTAERSNENMRRLADAALNMSDDALQQSSRNTEIVASALGNALYETQRTAKSEAGQIGEQIVKIAVPAAALAFVAAAVLR